MKLAYSREAHPAIAGVRLFNPRFYDGPVEGVTQVLLVGDWPEIEAAYAALGVPVERVDIAPAPAGAPSSVAKPPEKDPGEVEIPDDWRDLPWAGQELTIRALATSLTATPVLNKAEAIAAVEAELARRAAVEDDREVNADLEALGVEFDPRDSLSDRQAQRDAARAERGAA